MAGSLTHHILKQPEFSDDVKILIVRAPYYKEIADNLLEGAQQEIEAVGGHFDLVDVPGALEIPTAIGMAVACKITMIPRWLRHSREPPIMQHDAKTAHADLPCSASRRCASALV